MEKLRKYAKFVAAAAGVVVFVANEVVVQPEQDLSTPEGWIRVVIGVVTAYVVKQVPNRPS